METMRAAGPLDSRPGLSDSGRVEQTFGPSRALPRVNLLIVGPLDAVERVLDTLASDLGKPITTWRGGALVLPPPTAGGTLVLRDVDALPLEDQRLLIDWLERAAGRTQVVSTAAAPLTPRVETFVFISTLYYRLNTIYMDVTNSPAGSLDW